jgi:hypothetical protein
MLHQSFGIGTRDCTDGIAALSSHYLMSPAGKIARGF